MNILLIGGTGFIGSRVVAQLEQTEHRIAIFHRGNTETKKSGRTLYIEGDRANISGFKKKFRQFSPDVVIDIIPYTRQQAEAAMEVFSGITIRFIAISSCDVYRNYDGFRGVSGHEPDPVPLNVDSPLRNSRYPYRQHDGLDFEHKHNYEKIFVEEAVLNHAELLGTVLRLPAIYGPGDKQHRFYSYIKRMKDERPVILLSPTQAKFHWTHGFIENIASAIVSAALNDRAANKIYNVGEQNTPTLAQRIRDLGNLMDWNGDIETIPDNELPQHLKSPFNWTFHLETDTSSIREELNYKETFSYHQALDQTIQWELEKSPEGKSKRFDYRAEDEVLEKMA